MLNEYNWQCILLLQLNSPMSKNLSKLNFTYHTNPCTSVLVASLPCVNKLNKLPLRSSVFNGGRKITLGHFRPLNWQIERSTSSLSCNLKFNRSQRIDSGIRLKGEKKVMVFHTAYTTTWRLTTIFTQARFGVSDWSFTLMIIVFSSPVSKIEESKSFSLKKIHN